MAGGRAGRRAQLVERLDLEASLAQRADHLAVRQVELDRGPLGVVPLDAVEAELRAREAVRGDLGPGRRAEDDEDGVGEEDEPAARAQQPRGLGDPALGLAPQARPVLRQREVEARVRERDGLGVGLDQRELEAVPGLHRPRGRELLGGLVDAHRPRAAAGQPGREVGGPAAELDGVEAGDVRQCADVGLGDLPDAPVGLGGGPVGLRRLGVLARRDGPGPAVDLLVAHVASARPCAKPAASTSSTRRRSIRFAPMTSAARASGAMVRTSAPRARRESVSASAADWEKARSAPNAPRDPASEAVGLRQSTCVPRATGVASRFVGLHTPPSTYSRSAIRTGANTPGIEHDASTAWLTRVRGAPGAPKMTRRPLRRSTAAIRRRPSKRAPVSSTRRPSPGIERRVRGTARSAVARATAPAGVADARAIGARGVATARPTRPSPVATRPRRPSSSAAAAQSRAARASAPESGGRPAARKAATIEPAEVPTKYSHSRKSMPAVAPAPSSSPRIHASPSVPPTPSTSTSGRCVSGSAMAFRLGGGEDRTRPSPLAGPSLYAITYVRMEVATPLGSRVRALREGMDLSLRDLAERSGVSAPMLSQVERGETSPTLTVAGRIAAGLDLRLSQLLRLDEGGTVSVVRPGERRAGGALGLSRCPRRGGGGRVGVGGPGGRGGGGPAAPRGEVPPPPRRGQRAGVSCHPPQPGARGGGRGAPPMHEAGARETSLVQR